MLQIRLLQSRTQTIAILLIAAVGIVTATLASPVSAHEGRDVGDYNLVVGFLIEPAYEGQLNGVSLVVTRAANHEAAEDDSMMETKMEAEDHDSQPRSRTADVDVLTHGAVFISPGLGRSENFEFEITDELSGIEIPYHVHPGDQEGTISVSAETTDHVEDQSIMIMEDQLMPAKLAVNVGDTVVWSNHESQNAVIMSGPLSSMTSGMTSMLDAETPHVTAEAMPTTDRVSGLGSTLQVELTHISTDAARTMPLTEVFSDPGHYTAKFIPTAPGDYRMRFVGSIEGNAIDESFDSGPDTFDTVVPSDAIQFPIVLESNREVQNAAQGALDSVQDLETNLNTTSSTASVGMTIGIIGIIFGVIATGLSVFAITIATRRS